MVQRRNDHRNRAAANQVAIQNDPDGGFGSRNGSVGFGSVSGSPIEHARRHDHTASVTEQQIVRARISTLDVAEATEFVEPTTFAKALLSAQRSRQGTSIEVNDFLEEVALPTKRFDRAIIIDEKTSTKQTIQSHQSSPQPNLFFFVSAPIRPSNCPTERLA